VGGRGNKIDVHPNGTEQPVLLTSAALIWEPERK
jgi:hypothetical protein